MSTNLLFTASNQTDPYLNLAVEQYLVGHKMSVETPMLYLWKNYRTVVIGRNQNPFSEVNLEALAADGGHLLRRRTGGGAVYHDDGNLNFSFVVPKSMYDQQKQFSVIQRAVESFGLHTELSGRNDILCEGRKFSGNAFSKGLYNDLHHGTILISGDMSELQKYLRPKPAKLMKHGVASVRSRVVNLAELDPCITTDSISGRLQEAFGEVYGCNVDTILFKEIEERPEVKRLRDELVSDEWLYGDWQTFNAQRSGQFDWGGVDVSLSVHDGVITDVRIASDALDLEAIAQAADLLRGTSQAVPPKTDNQVARDIFSLLF